jgi:hypothetical protein
VNISEYIWSFESDETGGMKPDYTDYKPELFCSVFLAIDLVRHSAID